MGFSLATFNAKDLFDDAPPHVIGELDRGAFGPAEQTRATRLYRARLEAVAVMVRRLDADVLALQEVKNARVLDDLRALLPARGGVPAFGYGPARAGRADARGIACGLLSRFPVADARDHVADDLPFPVFARGDAPPFPGRLRTHRGVLETTVTLPDGTPLVLFVVHLKSPLPLPLAGADGAPLPVVGHRAQAEARARSVVARVAEALFVRGLVDARFDRDPGVQLAVAGDFNDEESSVAVRAVSGDLVDASQDALGAALAGTAPGEWAGRQLYPCARAAPVGARHSLFYRGDPRQPDHVLASRALWSRVAGARFLNETLREDSALAAAGGAAALESDHAPLLVTFA